MHVLNGAIPGHGNELAFMCRGFHLYLGLSVRRACRVWFHVSKCICNFTVEVLLWTDTHLMVKDV